MTRELLVVGFVLFRSLFRGLDQSLGSLNKVGQVLQKIFLDGYRVFVFICGYNEVRVQKVGSQRESGFLGLVQVGIYLGGWWFFNNFIVQLSLEMVIIIIWWALFFLGVGVGFVVLILFFVFFQEVVIDSGRARKLVLKEDIVQLYYLDQFLKCVSYIYYVCE